MPDKQIFYNLIPIKFKQNNPDAGIQKFIDNSLTWFKGLTNYKLFGKIRFNVGDALFLETAMKRVIMNVQNRESSVYWCKIITFMYLKLIAAFLNGLIKVPLLHS